MAEEQAPNHSVVQREHPEAKPADFPPVEDKSPGIAPRNIMALGDVSVRLSAQLGTAKMLVKDIVELRDGSVVELDKLAGEQIDIYLNDVFFAKGEVVVIGDSLSVRLTDIAGQEEGAEQDGD
jgi:flagellar motor switch protein FliN/FliY